MDAKITATKTEFQANMHHRIVARNVLDLIDEKEKKYT